LNPDPDIIIGHRNEKPVPKRGSLPHAGTNRCRLPFAGEDASQERSPTMKSFALLPCALLLALAGQAAAQTDSQPDSQTGAQAPAQSGPCQAEPQDQNGKQKPPVKDGADNGNDSLSGKLDPCGGVLQPPPTGDQGMSTPPPDEGKTPVIRPGEVPPQPPKP
jgi:hypothetical protein